MKLDIRNFLRENRRFIVFIVVMFAFRSGIADWNTVPTGSMKPTILEGDRILVNKLAYDLRLPFTGTVLLRYADPERGDIVVFDSEASDKRLVKRVIGLPGDVVSMRQNRLMINGEALPYRDINGVAGGLDRLEGLPGAEHVVRVHPEGYSPMANFPPVRVPDHAYLVLGDNRDNSADSRVIGFVPRDEIIGRTRSVVMSLDYDHYYLPRGDRFFHTL